jgi:hypothetical protein
LFGSPRPRLDATAEVTRYDIGAIGEQSVHHGYTRSFQVYSSELGAGATYSMSVSPNPVGPISLDGASGLFSYTPDVQDRKPFEITFRATAGPREVSESAADGTGSCL